MNLAALTQTALLGTERHPLPPIAGHTALDQRLARLDLARREASLLAAAALLAAYERAGRLPARDLTPPPPPCPDEPQPRIRPPAASLLRHLLAPENAAAVQPSPNTPPKPLARVLTEWLALATRASQIASPDLLPPLLELGSAHAPLRPALLPVLGERGRWLASLHPRWSWVIEPESSSDAPWLDGDPATRRLWLAHQRRHHPTHARDCLVATWQQESHENRAAFLALFETGLAPADEPFLEAALDDRRKEVRQTAAALLAQLPGSALVQRLATRALPLLDFHPPAPGNPTADAPHPPGRLEVRLPAACDRALVRDGLEPRPPAGLGERAWWLVQLLANTPLDAWTTRWNCSPRALLDAALAGDWHRELLEAWSRAALRQHHAPWARALLDARLATPRPDHLDHLADLLRVLPAPEQEQRLTALLEADTSATRSLHGQLLASLDHDWSVPFSEVVLRWLRGLTSQPTDHSLLRSQLPGLATRLAPATLTTATRDWPTTAPGWESWARGMDEFLALAQLRADLHTAFP